MVPLPRPGPAAHPHTGEQLVTVPGTPCFHPLSEPVTPSLPPSPACTGTGLGAHLPGCSLLACLEGTTDSPTWHPPEQSTQCYLKPQAIACFPVPSCHPRAALPSTDRQKGNDAGWAGDPTDTPAGCTAPGSWRCMAGNLARACPEGLRQHQRSDSKLTYSNKPAVGILSSALPQPLAGASSLTGSICVVLGARGPNDVNGSWGLSTSGCFPGAVTRLQQGLGLHRSQS